MTGSETDETDRSRGNRENHGRNQSPNHYRKAFSLRELLKRQFFKVALSLTGRTQSDERDTRNRTDQTGSGMRPSISLRIPLEAIAPVPYLSETLHCINPFYGAAHAYFDYEQEFLYDGDEHLYPDLEL